MKGPESESGITEDDGTESVTVAPGRYTYRVSPIDYGTDAADVHGSVDAHGGVEARIDVRMPRVYSLPLQVLDAEGVPVPRVQLEIRRGTKTKRTWTERQGHETLYVDRGEPLRIVALSDGPAAVLDAVRLPVRGRAVLRVPRSLRIRGRVLGPRGTPEFGTRVRAVRLGLEGIAEELWKAWTDERGSFDIEGPAAARYDVRAEHVAFGACATQVTVEPGLAPLTLQLLPLARFVGHLRDRAGAPVAGAEIAIRTGGRGWVGSGDDGRFELAFPGGNAPVELEVTHRQFVPLRLSIVPGRDRTQDLRLSRGVTLRIELRGPKARSVKLAIVEAAANRVVAVGRASKEQGPDGVLWTVERAPAGAVRVRLTPKRGAPRFLPYEAAEGGRVFLSAALD